MVTVHYTAKVKDSRTMELPEETQALGLHPGDEVQIIVSQEGDVPTELLSEDEQQEHFRAITARLFAETDAIERHPGTYSNPQKAEVATMIAEKHRKIGL